MPFEGSRAAFFGVVADEDDFVAVRKGAKPRALGDMPLVPARTGSQSSHRRYHYAALVDYAPDSGRALNSYFGTSVLGASDTSQTVDRPEPASSAAGPTALLGQSDVVFVPQAPARKAGEAKKSERKIEHQFKQAIGEAEKANRCQQEPASAAKPSYEEVTTRGRAAEPSLAVWECGGHRHQGIPPGLQSVTRSSLRGKCADLRTTGEGPSDHPSRQAFPSAGLIGA